VLTGDEAKAPPLGTPERTTNTTIDASKTGRMNGGQGPENLAMGR
jgi:hypothetical protein